MTQNKWSYLTPVLLVAALASVVQFSFPPPREVDLKNILGMWEGEFRGKDSTKPFPIRVIFKEDGSYQYDSALKTTKGIVKLIKGKIHLVWEGWEGMIFSLHQKNGTQILLNDNPNFGHYRLSRVKDFGLSPSINSQNN